VGPAAGGAAAVGSFGDGKIADGVVTITCAGAQALGEGFTSAGVACPYAGR